MSTAYHSVNRTEPEQKRAARKHSYRVATGAAAGLFTVAATLSGGTAYASAKHITLTEIDDYPAGLPQYAAYQWLFKTYETTHPNVTIAREAVSGTEILPKLLAEASTGTLPDLAVPDNPQIPNLAATGKFVNLDPYLKKWGQWGDYLPGSKAVTTVKGAVYGIQIGTNDLAIYYNKKIFAEAGVTPPKTWTWAQFLADSKQIVAKAKGLTYGAFGYGGNCGGNWQLLPFIYSQGLNVNNMTAPGTVAAVNFWAELLKDGLANREVITQCQSTNIPQLIQGTLAMAEDGPWDLPTFAKAHFTDWGVLPIPLRKAGDKESVPLGGEVWTIPKTNPATEKAAWDFIQWSQQPKILLQFDAKLGYFAVRPALWPAEEKADPKVTPFIQELKYAVGRTTVLGLSFNTYATDLNTALLQVLEGQKSAPDALAAALKAAKTTLASSGG